MTEAKSHGAIPGRAWRLVLLVGESRSERRALALQLKRAGYDVLEAEGVDEAIRTCAARAPEIVIADWMAPGRDGLELCRRFRSLPSEHYGYFILLTSSTDKADVAEGLGAGADDFLIKPVSAAELLARLSAAERILRVEESLRMANSRLKETLARLREKEAALERDLREAHRLQQGLVREREGRFGSFNLSLLMRPAGHIGGDLVGFFPLGLRRVGFFALDVSGHGVAAALLSARLAALLSGEPEHNIAMRPPDRTGAGPRGPVDILRHLNAMMLSELRTDSYFTMVYADLDTVTGRVRLAQAGHPHPVLQRADGSIELVGQGGFPVGVFPNAEFHEIGLQLEPGDRLFISSDGLIDSENARGEPLGDEGLQAILRTNALLRGNALLESICWSAANYSGGQRSDDISAVLVEHLGHDPDAWSARPLLLQ